MSNKASSLIELFEKDLLSKVIQKQVANLSIEQSLVKFFKYFDLENSGYCTLRDWIKTMEKLGIIYPRIQDNQEVFKQYDVENTGHINYKEFAAKYCSRISSLSKNLNSNNSVKVNNENSLERFNLVIKEKGCSLLLSLLKDIKLIDYKDSARLSIDDFLKVLTEHKISFNINDTKLLFLRYDKLNSGLIKYNELFNDLKNIYNNTFRLELVNNLYKSIIKQLNREMKLGDLKRIFKADNHPNVINNMMNQEEITIELEFLLDNFRFIKNIVTNESKLTKEEFIDFLILYGFSIEDNKTYADIINSVFSISHNQVEYREDKKGNQTKDRIDSNFTTNSNRSTTQIIPEEITEIIAKIKKMLKGLGKKTLFSIIKQFKFYDNRSGYINKPDYTKILKDFRLNLTITDIEKIFEKLCEKNYMLNYEKFISLLCGKISNNRVQIVKQIYSSISSQINSIITIDTLKSYYIGKNTKFDEELDEYINCWEIFHSVIKANKEKQISLQEMIEFYEIFGCFNENDKDFESEIKIGFSKQWDDKSKFRDIKSDKMSNEFRKSNSVDIKKKAVDIPKNERSEVINPPRINNNYPVNKIKIVSQSQDILSKLKEKLRKRGIRGLMNLHKQFVDNCSNCDLITFDDFSYVLKLQRLDLGLKDYEDLFNKYKSRKNSSFNFVLFLKELKTALSDSRLEVVENAFLSLDEKEQDSIAIDLVKLTFNASNHPDLIKRSEEEILIEFLDCFDLNYNILKASNDPNIDTNSINFQQFANFYEYVSFVYESDIDFIDVVKSHWQ